MQRPSLFAVVFLLLAPAVWASGEFKVELSLTTEQGRVSGTTYFVDGTAVELDGDEVRAVFDLAQAGWSDAEGRVTRGRWQSWIDDTIRESTRRAAGIQKERGRDFLRHLLDPRFEILEEPGLLIASNPYMTYRVRTGRGLDDEQATRLFAYSRLNAYRKAMALQQLPPFPEIAVLDALAARGLLPREIHTVLQADGKTMEADIRYRFSSLDAGQARRVRALLAADD